MRCCSLCHPRTFPGHPAQAHVSDLATAWLFGVRPPPIRHVAPLSPPPRLTHAPPWQRRWTLPTQPAQVGGTHFFSDGNFFAGLEPDQVSTLNLSAKGDYSSNVSSRGRTSDGFTSSPVRGCRHHPPPPFFYVHVPAVVPLLYGFFFLAGASRCVFVFPPRGFFPCAVGLTPLQALYFDPTTAKLYGVTTTEVEAISLTVTATAFPNAQPTGPGLPLFPGVTLESSDAVVSVSGGQQALAVCVCVPCVCVCVCVCVWIFCLPCSPSRPLHPVWWLVPHRFAPHRGVHLPFTQILVSLDIGNRGLASVSLSRCGCLAPPRMAAVGLPVG
jgi:hypothetical protein